jgi:hypothetical protein
MIHRLFNFTSALSLLLCVSAGALWVRSYWVDYSAAYASNDLQRLRRTAFSVEARGGQVDFHHYVADYTSTPRALDFFRRHTPPVGFFHATEDRSRFTALGGWGFHGYFREKWNPVDTVSMLIVPLWLPVLLFGLLPALWWKRRRKPRRGPTLCPTCGYDLRASAERCPECGRPITSNAGTPA